MIFNLYGMVNVTKYYETIKLILRKLGLGDIGLNFYSLVCGYKPNIIEYQEINLFIIITYFTVYKCWVSLHNKRQNINPLLVLYNEIRIRCNTNLYNVRTFVMSKNVFQNTFKM